MIRTAISSTESQKRIPEFDSDEGVTPYDKWKKRMNEWHYDYLSRNPQASVLIRPTQPRFRQAATQIDDMKAYRIRLGWEEKWNFKDFMGQGTSSEYIDLRRHYGSDRVFWLPFSSTIDNNGYLQSDQCFLSGLKGMGKTNLCSIFALNFPKRPNPTATLWISQKQSTADIDVPKLMEKLESDGKKCVKITVGEHSEYGRLPIDSLGLEDIRIWLNIAKSSKEWMIFKTIYYGFQRKGGGVSQALSEFIDHPKGQKYTGLYDGLVYGNILAVKKKDEFHFKPHMTCFLDISKLLLDNHEVADITTTGWLNYIYSHIEAMRREYKTQGESDYKKQWQGLILFDEFYELWQNYNLTKMAKTVSKIALQGRQGGTSLAIATQTLYGSRKERVTVSQADHIFQFKPSTKADQNFVKSNMGWADGAYDNMVTEIFDKVYPYASDDVSYKGKAILFSKESNTIQVVRLDLVEGVETRQISGG